MGARGGDHPEEEAPIPQLSSTMGGDKPPECGDSRKRPTLPIPLRINLRISRPCPSKRRFAGSWD